MIDTENRLLHHMNTLMVHIWNNFLCQLGPSIESYGNPAVMVYCSGPSFVGIININAAYSKDAGMRGDLS